MKNIRLSAGTVADINGQVNKVLRGLGNPEPPIDLADVRELLRLDRAYYSTADDGLLRETLSKLKIAGRQVLLRPTLLADAVQSLSLKALYLPDKKRILLDRDVPKLKHRWNEAHEIGHDIVPWHAEMMLGDTEQTLSPDCHAMMEAEANYAAGQILFLATRFLSEAESSDLSIKSIRVLSKSYGNTLTSTMWRFVEEAHASRPILGLVTGHPHPAKWPETFDASNPARYFIQSPAFRERFSNVTAKQLFDEIVSYSGPQRGGTLGEDNVILADDNGDPHVFHFETFFNSYEALTLGCWVGPHRRIQAARRQTRSSETLRVCRADGSRLRTPPDLRLLEPLSAAKSGASPVPLAAPDQPNVGALLDGLIPVVTSVACDSACKDRRRGRPAQANSAFHSA